MQDVVFKVKFTIYGNGRGWCFTLNDFSRLGNPVAVRKALSRLQASGFIRRIGRGLYEYPRQHATLGKLPPDITCVVKAIARRDRIKTLPSGAQAANLLGLSDQVPGKITYLTDGRTRKIRIGKINLIFKKTTPKNMATAGTPAGIVIQALRHLGKDHVDAAVIAKLRKRFSKNERVLLGKQGKTAPAWVLQVIDEIVKGSGAHG
jgi:hypothetical protein